MVSATDWVRAATRRLAADGVDAVRGEPLATELGVSKGSFYWHFSDRAALLDGILDHWRATGTTRVIAHVEATAPDPAGRLRELLRVAFAHPDRGFDVAVRTWAAREQRAARAVGEVDDARTAYLTTLLREAGAAEPVDRAAVVYRALLGEYAVRHGGGPALSPAAVDALTAWALA